MKFVIVLDITKVRKRMGKVGGYIAPKRGKKSVYNRKKEKSIT